jgi:hypothetical protein
VFIKNKIPKLPQKSGQDGQTFQVVPMTKRILALALIISLVLLPIVVSAGDTTINEGSPVFTEPTSLPIGKETVTPIETKPVYELSVFSYNLKQISIITRIVDTVKGVVGIPTEMETITENIDVEIDGSIIATIPKGSKFADMEIHTVCLPWQYGTDGWYDCEQRLL